MKIDDGVVLLLKRSVAAALDDDRCERHRPEQTEARGHRRAKSQRTEQGRRGERRHRLPHRHVQDAGDRTGDERGERDQHAHAAAAGRVERPRCAAASQLHADAEHERADDDRHADRRDRAANQPAEDLAVGEQRQEDDARHREHQHLRAQAAAAALGDRRPPRRREPERGVIEDKAGAGADQEERRLPPAEDEPQIQDARRDQNDRN